MLLRSFLIFILFIIADNYLTAAATLNTPFKGWLNVKTQFGAKGDGRSDDTQSLQKGLNAVAAGTGAIVLYLPAGKYKISSTLIVNQAINFSVVGESSETTILEWTGQPQSIMLKLNGVAYSKFDQITFDGKGRARSAIEQSWDGKHPYFDSANEYANDIFKDVDFGIHGGNLGFGFAEATIFQDKFIRNALAGVSLGNFNSLDIWVRNCLFDHCKVGVTNHEGAGNFKVYNCLFDHSSESDLEIGNTGEFSVLNNISIGSGKFFNAESSRNPSCIIITGNEIIDPISNICVNVENQGPVIFSDNTIRSLKSAESPIVTFRSNCLGINNTFTVQNAIDAGAPSLVTNNKCRSRVSLTKLKKTLDVILPSLTDRVVFEVPKGANAKIIQRIINDAVKLGYNKALVHFPYGIYYINVTLSIPAGSGLELVGDGFGDHHASMLCWRGEPNKDLLKLPADGGASLKDITLQGDSTTTNIVINNTGDNNLLVREFHQSNGQKGIYADHLGTVAVFEDVALSGVKVGVQVDGTGSLIITNGAESNNQLSNYVSDGGLLIVKDCWYEGKYRSNFVKVGDNSTFIAEGDHVSIPNDCSLLNAVGSLSHTYFIASDLAGASSVTNLNFMSKPVFIGILAEDENLLKGDGKIGVLNRVRTHGSTILNGGSYPFNDIHQNPMLSTQTVEKILARFELHMISGENPILERVMSIGGKVGIHIVD